LKVYSKLSIVLFCRVGVTGLLFAFPLVQPMNRKLVKNVESINSFIKIAA